MRTARPSSTVVISAQVSGQSCGQAPRTCVRETGAEGAGKVAVMSGLARERRGGGDGAGFVTYCSAAAWAISAESLPAGRRGGRTRPKNTVEHV
jgi:hypothetical protein